MAPAQKKFSTVQACGDSSSEALSVNQPVAEKADVYSEFGERGRNPAYVLLSTLFVEVPYGCVNKLVQLKTIYLNPPELL